MKRNRQILGAMSAGAAVCVGGFLVLHNGPFQSFHHNTNSLTTAQPGIPSSDTPINTDSAVNAWGDADIRSVAAVSTAAGQVQAWQQQFQQQVQQIWQQRVSQQFQQQVQQVWQQRVSQQWQQQLQQWIQQLQQQLAQGQSAGFTQSTGWGQSTGLGQSTGWGQSTGLGQSTGWGGSTGLGQSTGSGQSSGSQTSPQTLQSPTSSPSIPTNTQQSGNWAGYIDLPETNSDPFTTVSGTWKVPNISGSKMGAAAQWIGLGGVTSQDLLQMGTIEDFENGQAVANIFWEKLPASAQMVMSVPIGSTISATIKPASSTTWNLEFRARTPSGQAISKTIPVTVDSAYAQDMGTSAEWISEDPSNGQNQLLPLANMGTVNYTNATVDGQPLGSGGNQVTPVALIDNYGDVLVAPSSILSNGTSFSTETLSTGSGSMQQGTRRGGGHGFIPGGRYGYGHGYGHYGRHGR